jgi:arsenite-transporting ATPase
MIAPYDSPVKTLKTLGDRLQLALFSGKGGVGKTTLSCGLARSWARSFPQEQILLISTDPAHSLGDVLQLSVSDRPTPVADLPNLKVRALDAAALLQNFKTRYGATLELLLERGSFVEASDLGPVWDLNWPGVDELMGILEIQRLFRDQEADRVVVDMAPSGHSLNLFGLMDFLDRFLQALDLFQEKHRAMQRAFTGSHQDDEADRFLQQLQSELQAGRDLLQDPDRTACCVVAIAEPMSFLETQRFLQALETLGIPWGGIFVNQLLLPPENPTPAEHDRLQEQQQLLQQFQTLAANKPLIRIPLQNQEPIGGEGIDRVMNSEFGIRNSEFGVSPAEMLHEENSEFGVPNSLPDFIAQNRKLILLGGKGGVGKTTVAAALGWGIAQRHGDRKVRLISIDPAHSLGDAFGRTLGHEPQLLQENLSAQEVDADRVLDQFRQDYLWELAEMMSGDKADSEATLKLAYGPEAWRQLADQSLPGIDEMLSLITVMQLLEQGEQDLIVLDTAPTGHLLRFLEMPTALADWLAWIFKLWIKYQAVAGRADLMTRLRELRKQVMETQKKLKDPQHTEFIAVFQNQTAILAETRRLVAQIHEQQIAQRFVVHNRYEAARPLAEGLFPGQTVVALPNLPRSVAAIDRIQIAAQLLFGEN